MKGSSHVGILLAVTSALALASCGAPDAEVLESGDDRVLVGSDDGNNMAGVGIGGTVAMVGNCLGLDSNIVIWPPGTTLVSSDPLTIDLKGFGPVTVGDVIEGGGYDVGMNEPPDGLAIPESCEGESLVSFFPNS